MRGLHLARGTEIDELSLAHVSDHVGSPYSPESEAVFAGCTGTRPATIMEDLEVGSGIPVLSANHVTIWDVLRVMGVEGMPSDLERPFLTGLE